jgi:hypothetical protein
MCETFQNHLLSFKAPEVCLVIILTCLTKSDQLKAKSIASAGRAWLTRLTMQLNTQYEIQADTASTADEANPY